MTSKNPAIMWFRQDLRISDNPALFHACSLDKPLICVFVLDEISPDTRAYGAAQRWWLHHSLTSLKVSLAQRGVTLLLKRGPAPQVIDELVNQTGADAIFWNRRYGEGEQAVDRQIKADFEGEARSFAGLLLHEPSKVRNGTGAPYKVYTPFWKNFRAGPAPRKPLGEPQTFTAFAPLPEGEDLAEWSLLPTAPDWSSGIGETFTPGEAAAQQNLQRFLGRHIDGYKDERDFPGLDHTSRMSPHLRFGEISPHQLWYASLKGEPTLDDEDSHKGRLTWRKEVVWREFSYHLLQEWPDLATKNFNPKFDEFPWLSDEMALSAWQKGQTGYPIVDAGMRQLWQTGWMHNRVRMIVGSFLVKHLLMDWREGEKWFWDTLVDGDPAANTASWQWVAGTGADAAPYFRIFNPIMQAAKFDPDGSYIKKYVPELKHLPAEFLPAPWEAPLLVLKEAGVVLGKDYPTPIVDHKFARERALNALESTKPPA